MAKYVARIYCMVEVQVEAEIIGAVMDVIDLNNTDINQLPHVITQIDDVVEVEEV